MTTTNDLSVEQTQPATPRATAVPGQVTHIGRSWAGHHLEDDCPCPKAACGLVISTTTAQDCAQHALAAGKTIRQGHTADHCPAAAPPERTPGIVEVVSSGYDDEPITVRAHRTRTVFTLTTREAIALRAALDAHLRPDPAHQPGSTDTPPADGEYEAFVRRARREAAVLREAIDLGWHRGLSVDERTMLVLDHEVGRLAAEQTKLQGTVDQLRSGTTAAP